SFLIVNEAEKTLSYQAAGSDAPVVIAHFDSEQQLALSAANVIG
ncbi:hypothetical protein HMPREF9370_2491, partial [Neisseria wadsworthii 9715]